MDNYQKNRHWLAHPAWTGIAGIVAILALGFAIFTWVAPHPDELFVSHHIGSGPQATPAEGNPYGGTLVASDPMSGPGSAFDWQTGNDSLGDQCNFENNAYHVFGICDSNGLMKGNSSISAKFAFEIVLNAGKNCGALHFYFHSQSRSQDVRVCWNGEYYVGNTQFTGDTHTDGTTTAMLTNQSNVLGVVADSTGLTLYVNYTRVYSVPGTFTGIFGFKLAGWDANGNRAGVVYTYAHLWSF